jgi:predicted GNAT superfamily acetyltransferase
MGKASVGVSLREFQTAADFIRCTEIQREVWEFEDSGVVPIPVLRTCHRQGGLLIGAFGPKAGMIGFAFSFPVPWGYRVIHHSHMLAVLPPYQNQGLGSRLKYAQYQHLAGKIPLMTWTFDPLEAKNAFLNLNKLGVVVRKYFRDFYGTGETSGLHRGIGTDRFLAEWHFCQSPPGRAGRQLRTAVGADIPRVISVSDEAELLIPNSVDLECEAGRLYVEVPTDIQDLKRVDMSAARAWRQYTRSALEHYLKRDYEVVRLDRTEGRPIRVFYLLERTRHPTS